MMNGGPTPATSPTFREAAITPKGRPSLTPAPLSRALAGLRVDAPPGFVSRVLATVDSLDREGDQYALLDAPAGAVFIAFNSHGISHVLPGGLVDNDAARFEAAFREQHNRDIRPAARPPAGLLQALRSGRATSLRFDLRDVSEFERAVLLKALEIPPGEVRPYAWVAREIGRPKAVRAVGSALGRNPVPLLIPCHRVVRSNGEVGEYGFGSSMKRALLEREGVDLEELEALARRQVHYVGSDTTGVFCLPTCHHARRISRRHRVFFRTAAAADAAGYRQCRHCRPTSAQAAEARTA